MCGVVCVLKLRGVQSNADLLVNEACDWLTWLLCEAGNAGRLLLLVGSCLRWLSMN